MKLGLVPLESTGTNIPSVNFKYIAVGIMKEVSVPPIPPDMLTTTENATPDDKPVLRNNNTIEVIIYIGRQMVIYSDILYA